MKALKLLAVFALIAIVSCKAGKHKDLPDGLYADIETNKGTILLELYYKTVPITTANFVSLAEGTNTFVEEKLKGKPFYDGLTFHRVVPNFMIQGGDPRGNGSGGPGYQFDNEHPKNEDGSQMYVYDKPGVLAMANAGRDTNGSQFFITHVEYPSLNGGYTVFGQVVEGQNVVDSIAIGDKMVHIDIVRVGKEAKKFDAAKVFNNYFAEIEKATKIKVEKANKLKEEFVAKAKEYKSKAKEFDSGLKMYITKKGSGVKPKRSSSIRVNCVGRFTDGNIFYTTDKQVATDYNKYNAKQDQMGGYNPLTTVYDETAQMIPGFREGMLNMNYGDKAILFIPPHLGYGSQNKGIIPPNSDLVFELELVDESQD